MLRWALTALREFVFRRACVCCGPGNALAYGMPAEALPPAVLLPAPVQFYMANDAGPGKRLRGWGPRLGTPAVVQGPQFMEMGGPGAPVQVVNVRADAEV